MTEEKRVSQRAAEDADAGARRALGQEEDRTDRYPARVVGGRLQVDAPTRLRDTAEVQLDLLFDFEWDELTPEQRERMARYEGRLYGGTVRNGRLVVDEPTLLPDGIHIEVIEHWPLPPEEQVKLEARLEQSFQNMEAGRGILADDVIEKLRIRHTLSPADRDRFDAEWRAELDRRLANATPGGHITMQDVLARWKKRS